MFIIGKKYKAHSSIVYNSEIIHNKVDNLIGLYIKPSRLTDAIYLDIDAKQILNYIDITPLPNANGDNWQNVSEYRVKQPHTLYFTITGSEYESDEIESYQVKIDKILID